MKARLFIILLLTVPLTAVSQLDDDHFDARSAAMGGCFLPPTDSTVNLNVGWRQGFMTKGMASRTVALDAPVGRHGRAAALYNGFGDVDYNEQQLAAGYMMAVAPWLSVMVYGLYSRVGTLDAHYDTQRWLDAGGGVTLGGERVWGYLAAGSRSWSSVRPWGLRAGVVFRNNHQLTSAVAATYYERLRLRCGMEYVHDRHAFVRAGIATNPLVLTFGVGYRQRHFHIDLATEVHSILGLSPQIMLGLCL